MADLINLNRARKDRARAAKAGKAAENRVVFGRTRDEKDVERAKAEQAARALEGHRLTRDKT